MASGLFARKSEGFWSCARPTSMAVRAHGDFQDDVSAPCQANDGNASHSQASAFEFGLAFFLKGANSFERIASREAQRVHFIFGFQLQLDRYAAYAIASGVGPETVAIVRKSVEANSSMVVPERNEQLLAEARFKDSEVFYADMTSRGWIAYA
jgi:hypothetical protein